MARWFLDRFAQKAIPSVSLRHLFPGALFIGCPDLVVSGCSSDSRRIEPGEVYVSLASAKSEEQGESEIARAFERGAVGVVLERACLNAAPLQVVVHDAASAHARICQALAGEPSRKLPLVGIAGRLGVDLASAYLRSILTADGGRIGHVDQVSWSDGRSVLPTAPLPWKPEVWAGMLARMAEERCTAGVLTVDRETLTKRSIEGVVFETAILTNLFPEQPASDDALIQERRRHARLFRMLSPEGAAILNADDTTCDLLGAVNLDGDCITFGVDRPADVNAELESTDATSTTIRLNGVGKPASVRLRLVGKSAVSGALAAAAAAHSQGIRTAAIVAGLENLSNQTGRLESLAEGLEFEVRRDHAASPIALKYALSDLRTHFQGRIICVLSDSGCEDRSFRRTLAETMERYSDLVIVSSSRANRQDGEVLEELLSGFDRPAAVFVEPDRRKAIEYALATAQKGDCVFLRGVDAPKEPGREDRSQGVLALNDQAIINHWIRGRDALQRRTSA